MRAVSGSRPFSSPIRSPSSAPRRATTRRSRRSSRAAFASSASIRTDEVGGSLLPRRRRPSGGSGVRVPDGQPRARRGRRSRRLRRRDSALSSSPASAPRPVRRRSRRPSASPPVRASSGHSSRAELHGVLRPGGPAAWNGRPQSSTAEGRIAVPASRDRSPTRFSRSAGGSASAASSRRAQRRSRTPPTFSRSSRTTRGRRRRPLPRDRAPA